MSASLAAAGVDYASIALNAANPKDYAAFMLTPPPYASPFFDSPEAAVGEDLAGANFGTACSFVAALTRAQINVTVSCVDRPGADMAGVRKLASALGATEVRVRSWHE